MLNHFLRPHVIPQGFNHIVVRNITIRQSTHYSGSACILLKFITLSFDIIVLNFLSSFFKYFLILYEFLMTRFQIFGKWEFLLQMIIIRCYFINQWGRRTLIERWQGVHFFLLILLPCLWRLVLNNLWGVLAVLLLYSFLAILGTIRLLMNLWSLFTKQKRFLLLATCCHCRVAASSWWYITLKFS